jgi:hypothetical protein
MSKATRIILLPLLLTIILALSSIYGCTGGVIQSGTSAAPGATGETSLSQQQLEQIIADSLTTFKSLNTYKFNMNMDMSMTASGGKEPGEMTIKTKADGAMDTSSQQMHMNMSMSMEGGPEVQVGPQEMAYELYVLSDYIYMNFNVAGMGNQWLKMPVTDEVSAKFGLNLASQQMGPLESPVKIECLRSESVDGIDCYVISVTPNLEKMGQWLMENQRTTEGIDWGNMVKISDMFKKMEYVCYVAKDSNYLLKMVSNMVFEFNSEQAGLGAGEFDKMTMEISADMKLYDHNQPLSITLPDEAANAMEVSEDMLFQ